MPTNVNMLKLRSAPGTLIDRVFYRNESFVVEKAGEPRAVIVPVREYEQMQRRTQAAKKRLWKMTQEVRKRMVNYDPAEVQAVIDEAVEEVRKENRLKVQEIIM